MRERTLWILLRPRARSGLWPIFEWLFVFLLPSLESSSRTVEIGPVPDALLTAAFLCVRVVLLS